MKVLIVDDATVMRKQLGKILEDLGVTAIREAGCPDDAKVLLGQEDGFDLIISDWHMPKATGLDLLRWVRSESRVPTIKFLMLTTEQEKAKILEAARLGLQGYLFKPAQKDLLRAKLTDIGLLSRSA